MSDLTLADIKSPKVINGYNAIQTLLLQGKNVTPNAVAAIGKFSGANLSELKNAEWEWLAERIKDVSGDLSPAIKKEIDAAKKDARCWEDKYNAQFHDNANLINLTVEYQHRYNLASQKLNEKLVQFDDLFAEKERYESAYHDLEKRRRETQGATPIVAQFGRTVISTDEEMLKLTGGVYQWDSETLAEIHSAANQRLEYELRNSRATRLYITVGRPGAGKSTWVENHSNPDTRRAIYFDATNANSFNRRELIRHSKYRHPDCAVCVVYFTAEIDECVKRNSLRPDRGISRAYIKQFQLEPPVLSEKFDELIVVRD